ncbi:MAG TPA: helix-turn-helix domain-containing protein [Spongiibacteraceae bacterium]|nr:helix-turn-helix domain-containing protein [Spongiibacteraceae bacterium]
MLSIDHVDREVLRALIDKARSLDIDLEVLLRELNVSCSVQSLHSDPRISFADYQQLQRGLSMAIRQTIYERVGKRAPAAEETEVMLHYMIGADDLGGALVRMKFFASIIGDRLGDGAIRLSIEPPLLAKLYLRVGMPEELHQTFASHFLWEQLKVIEILAWLIGQPIDLVKAELPFAADSSVDHLVARLRCPVSYGALGYGFYFRKTLLQKPVVRSLVELKSFLGMFGALFVSEEHFDRPPLKQRIERILEKQALENRGMPSATELANAMNMSEATLRRRLRETGCSFSEIKRSCQMRLGKKLLVIPNRNITDIALQLGYQDVNAFRRAFRQSLGNTPEGFRRSCHIAPAV